MITICGPPIATPPIFTTLSLPPRNSRATSLYGFSTGVTDSTPAIAAIGFSRIDASSPITPITVRIAPRLMSVLKPHWASRASMCSICSSVAPGLVTMIMETGGKASGRGTKGNGDFRPRRRRTPALRRTWLRRFFLAAPPPRMSQTKSPIGVIFLTIFISMIGFGIVIPVLPVYAKNPPFQLNPGQLGWLVGIFSLVQLFSAPLIGKLSDRIGRKPVLLVSIIGTAAGYFITGAAQAAWMLFLGRIIDGARGGNIATAQACIADTTTPQERSKAMGSIGAAFGLGFILGPAIGG